MATPPHPIPRHKPSASADGAPVSNLLTERVQRSLTMPQPVPKPRQRVANRTEAQMSLAEDEDIYTDNSPVTNQIEATLLGANQIKSRKVAWADETNSKLERIVPPPTDMAGNAHSIVGLTSNQKELTDKELALNLREAELKRLSDRLDAQRSDQEFALTEREREVQLREDSVHMREKDLNHREFDLQNLEPLDGFGGSQLPDLRSKEMALNERSRLLDYRERELQDQTQHLKDWEANLRERELKVSSREAELSNAQSRVYQYNQYPPQQSYQQQQPFSPPGGGGYYLPQSYAPLQGYKQPPPQQQQYAPHASMISPTMPPGPPPVTVPSSTTPPPRAVAPQSPLMSARATGMSIDEEVATMLQRNLILGSSQIDEDAEMARRLQEEEEREHLLKVEMDTQLAMVMQGNELGPEGTDNILTQTEGKALEELQRKLEEQLAHKREMEEHDRQLAADLAKELAEAQPMPSRNDLDT